ncbi:OmpA family protein [Dokdonella sp.]|uniref:OmpA family protein n=1 Tax=Dokdonella sp. TaxID=2291710 RepID=UPI003C49D7A9
MIRLILAAALVFAALLVSGHSEAARSDVDVERLSRSLAQLKSDPKLGTYAASEIARAQTALEMLQKDGRGKKRPHLLYMAERRVDIAWAAAQVTGLENEQEALQREHGRLQLAAARNEAEQARRELDQQRLLAQIRAEEAQREALNAEQALMMGEQATADAREEAAQARRLADAQAQETALARKEAELAGAAADALRVRLSNLRATQGSRGMQMTLDDVAFASGQSSLRPEARESLDKLAEFVAADPAKKILIEGHTDSTGSANANLILSQKRAEAVRETLVAMGVDAARMTAVGVGAERPVASNDSAAGRAKNRRVDVILEE